MHVLTQTPHVLLRKQNCPFSDAAEVGASDDDEDDDAAGRPNEDDLDTGGSCNEETWGVAVLVSNVESMISQLHFWLSKNGHRAAAAAAAAATTATN